MKATITIYRRTIQVELVSYTPDLAHVPTPLDGELLAQVTHAVLNAKTYDQVFRGSLDQCLSFIAKREYKPAEGAQPPRHAIRNTVALLSAAAAGAYLQNLAWSYDAFGWAIVTLPGIPIAIAAILVWLQSKEASQ